jgi:ribosomal protein S18 acetylase RimI-like enzyme
MLRDAVSAEVDIAVLPDSRGSGVGTELMAAAEAWAFEHGAEFMTLQVHTANVDAIRFYQERHGWRTSGLFMLKRPEPPA